MWAYAPVRPFGRVIACSSIRGRSGTRVDYQQRWSRFSETAVNKRSNKTENKRRDRTRDTALRDNTVSRIATSIAVVYRRFFVVNRWFADRRCTIRKRVIRVYAYVCIAGLTAVMVRPDGCPSARLADFQQSRSRFITSDDPCDSWPKREIWAWPATSSPTSASTDRPRGTEKTHGGRRHCTRQQSRQQQHQQQQHQRRLRHNCSVMFTHNTHGRARRARQSSDGWPIQRPPKQTPTTAEVYRVFFFLLSRIRYSAVVKRRRPRPDFTGCRCGGGEGIMITNRLRIAREIH